MKHREWVQKEVETLKKAGVIVRSISPWASPIVVVVPKKTEPGVQEVEEVDEIGTGQRKSRDVVCWQYGEKGHLQCDLKWLMIR